MEGERRRGKRRRGARRRGDTPLQGEGVNHAPPITPTLRDNIIVVHTRQPRLAGIHIAAHNLPRDRRLGREEEARVVRWAEEGRARPPADVPTYVVGRREGRLDGAGAGGLAGEEVRGGPARGEGVDLGEGEVGGGFGGENRQIGGCCRC